MDEKEIYHYKKLIDSLDGKYSLGYSPVFNLPFLTLKPGEESRVGGLVIGFPDMISIYPIIESKSIEDISGIVVDGGMHLYEDRSNIRRYIHDVNFSFFNNELDSAEDLEFLIDAEENLFKNGLKDYFRRPLRYVIALR